MATNEEDEVEIELVPNETTGEVYRPRVALDHDPDRMELYVIVGEEVGAMAEAVPSDTFDRIRKRLGV